jgi:hypothetical protein
MTGADAATAIAELRTLAEALHDVDAAAAAAEWDDDEALSRLAARAQQELATAGRNIGEDIAVAGASPLAANAVVAVAVARAAISEAVLAVARARDVEPHHRQGPASRRAPLARLVRSMRHAGRDVGAEIRHIIADKPRMILLRIVITLAISLSLVAFYHFSGWSRYSDLGNLTVYLFGAVVGSVVCTNALCFEADRVRGALVSGNRVWRILIAKNLAMAAMITVASLPVVAALTVAADANPFALIDQMLTMVFIWLGVGNVLSVVYPLRHEPVSARLHDGTWKPYLFAFVLSYGVGLAVNVMIYWRLWARQVAATEMVGGDWTAFLLILASALSIWVLLTVFAVSCSREPAIRRLLSREMVAYRKTDAVPSPQ